MSLSSTLAFAAALFSGTLASASLLRERRSVVGWSFVAGMAGFALESALVGLSVSTDSPGDIGRWQRLTLSVKSVLPAIWLCFSLTYSRGNHAEFLLRWRYVLIAVFLVPAILVVSSFNTLFVSLQPTERGAGWWLGFGSSGVALNFLFLATSILILMNLEQTFRTAIGTMRWRIKFVALGLAVIFSARIYTGSQSLLFSGFTSSLLVVDSVALIIGCALIATSFVRSGLIATDVYPSHTIIFRSITAIIAGIYLVIMAVLARFVASFGAIAAFPLEIFLVLISLVVLALLLISERVRLATKQFVSRHFSRPQYDYRTVWRRFTESATSSVDQSSLCRTTVHLVAEVFQALSVSIWLIDEKRGKLTIASSSSISGTTGGDLGLQEPESGKVIDALRKHPEPVDIDASDESWAIALRKCHPHVFRSGGHRVCVPMMGGGELLGLMILGDRVSGVPFSLQDFDLLRCVGSQLAASLRNLQLSQRLVQAKELEAFQAMSSFFVHDLKNTASTLSLMLQNLPVHFNDPEFRKDALRGISNTVSHINHLIERLSLLRHDMDLRLVESDLNEVIIRTLEGWKESAGVDCIKDLQALPKIPLDREQMPKVITNLVLNAIQAVAGNGQVCIGTAHKDGWVTLEITDNGCGMSAEFIDQSLFRAFQTTKKGGLGIGMFQSKLIVELHGGRIDVKSELGKGTTFRVILPHRTQNP